MEFRFNVNELFKQPIVEINSNLIPPGFTAPDRRSLWEGVSKVSEVINMMGEASASAQGLTKPITTAERLRNAEQKIYLLVDHSARNGKGQVTGMLKIGRKSLYIFDRDGHHYQVQPPCVLDFYIHESKQRTGLGKKLFEHMLEKEQVAPCKLAIDRPSDKFLGFLNKHYSLNNAIRQMNNYVVYDGFFPEPENKEEAVENNNTGTPTKKLANGLQGPVSSPYGRYGAPRPPCSMGQIIHNQSPLASSAQEPTGSLTSLPFRPAKKRIINESNPKTEQEIEPLPKLERPQSLSLQQSEEIDNADENDNDNVRSKVPPNNDVAIDNIEKSMEKVKIPENTAPVPNVDDADKSKKTPSHLTEQGFFDLKFYHNKLW